VLTCTAAEAEGAEAVAAVAVEPAVEVALE
jgi:hypothetical protein